MFKKLPLIITLCIFLNLKTTSYASLKINEFLVHPSTGGKEWVEFYNPDIVDLSSYFLDDDEDFNSDSGSSSKKILSEINISNPNYPYFECSSFLNNDTDFVVLFSPDGQIIDKFKYETDPGIDISMGRCPDGTGEVNTLVSQTLGFVNSLPPTSTPTVTPTFTPTPSPSKTPTPTAFIASAKTPTPTKTSQVTIKISPILSVAKTSFKNSVSSISSSKKLVLGENILGSSTPTLSIAPSKENNQSSRNTITGVVLIAIGLIFITTCAILGFLFYKNKKKNI